MLLRMSFSSLHEVENRLGEPTPLTPQEIREFLPWMNQIGEAGVRRLNAQLALQSHEALQEFERLSSRLTKWLTALSLVLGALTIMVGYGGFLLAHLDRTAGPSSGAQESPTPISSSKKSLGPWKVKFGIPGSAEVPEKSPILKYSFVEDANTGFGYIAVTAENLSDRSYSVRYTLYGYDQDGRRVSEGNDDFTIGRRETVLRKVFLVSQQSVQGQLGSVFSIQVVLQE